MYYSNRNDNGTIVVAGIALTLFLGVGAFWWNTGWKDDSEKEALAFAQELGLPENTKATCTDRDTDGDGYVSCTLHSPGEEGPTITPVDCAPVWGGCRITVPRIPANGRGRY